MAEGLCNASDELTMSRAAPRLGEPAKEAALDSGEFRLLPVLLGGLWMCPGSRTFHGTPPLLVCTQAHDTSAAL